MANINYTGIPYVVPVGKDKPKIITLVPNDPGSRYKTRQLQIQVVGKSKMIKTVLVNILDVSKDMQVPPTWIGVFMGYDIGAQAKFDAKKPERQQAHISGEHEIKDLSRIMEKFLHEVVLCPVCGLPEILISYESKKIMGRCRACGGNSEMPVSNEKFKNFIIKNPPGGSDKKGEKEAFKGNTGAAKKEATKEKSTKESKPKTSKKKQESDDEEDDDDVVWFTDTSEEATRKRREEMMPKALDEKSKEAEIEEYTKAIKEGPLDKVFDKFKQLKIDQSLNDDEFLDRIFSSIFGNSTDLLSDTKAHHIILKNYVKDDATRKSLLKYLDNLCGNVNTALAAKVALVLKELYDNDILDESSILNWYEEGTTPLVKEKSLPIIKWLKEADEEDSDDEDDDDEEDDEDEDEEDDE